MEDLRVGARRKGQGGQARGLLQLCKPDLVAMMAEVKRRWQSWGSG